MSLPIIDLTPLSHPCPSPSDLLTLSAYLSTAFSTTGFAYLTHAPLSFTHSEIFSLAQGFFSLPNESKLSVVKKSFRSENKNTYRGYFPVQASGDNSKEGFEIGGKDALPQLNKDVAKFNLNEENVWPEGFEHGRERLELLHEELQALSEKLLSLLAVALGREEGYFKGYMEDSLSTLRLLHYPANERDRAAQELCCTPHTDSGILTLLHQDATGGLEILGVDDRWIPAPYVEGSMVVNVGDLMGMVSGGMFKATVHRVRRSGAGERFSVPFFFEPGAGCVVRSVGKGAEGAEGKGVWYGRHVLEKMRGWVEFRDEDGGDRGVGVVRGEEVVVGA